MNNKSNKLIIYTIGIALCFITLFIWTTSFKSGINLNSTQDYDKYESLDELYNHTTLRLELPDFVTSHTDLKISSLMGQLIEVYCNDFVLKAAPFANNNADPLGLYDECTTDNMYKISNNNIKFFRYRKGYKEYPHCIIINWCTEDVAYGIMVEELLTEDDAINILGLDKKEFIETNPEENDQIYNLDNTEDDADNSPEIYKVNDKLQLKIPQFNSYFDVLYDDTIATFYINKTLIFSIIYNEYDINNGASEDEKDINIKDGVVFRYITSNPFENGSTAYNDYEKFISTIDIIIDSIECQY